MKLRSASTRLKAFLVATTLAASCGAAYAQEAAQPAVAKSAHKIGVVDRKKVFDGFNKKKQQWDSLEARKKKAETDLNGRLDALKAEQDSYKSKRDGMTEEQRSAAESALNKKMLQLQADGQTAQEELNRDGERIIKAVTGEINEAIKKIGKDEGYSLILEADTAISSVVYFADAMDITDKVLGYVNGGGGATPTASAPTPEAPKAVAANPPAGERRERDRR